VCHRVNRSLCVPQQPSWQRAPQMTGYLVCFGRNYLSVSPRPFRRSLRPVLAECSASQCFRKYTERLLTLLREDQKKPLPSYGILCFSAHIDYARWAESRLTLCRYSTAWLDIKKRVSAPVVVRGHAICDGVGKSRVPRYYIGPIQTVPGKVAVVCCDGQRPSARLFQSDSAGAPWTNAASISSIASKISPARSKPTIEARPLVRVWRPAALLLLGPHAHTALNGHR